MRYLITLVVVVCLMGCGKMNTSLIFKESFQYFDVLSYRPITERQKWILRVSMRGVIKHLGQTPKGRFEIRIVHNLTALEDCFNNKNTWGDSTIAFYRSSERGIWLMYNRITPDTVGHEMVHALVDINNLETVDDESLAYYIGEKLDYEYLFLYFSDPYGKLVEVK